MDLDYTSNQNPYIIPYQTAGFWFTMGLDDKQKYNNSIRKYAALASTVIGEEWVKGTITVEVFNVTRNRLIQTGSTNYMTYDFETSQNLIWCEANRAIIWQDSEPNRSRFNQQ